MQEYKSWCVINFLASFIWEQYCGYIVGRHSFYNDGG